MSINEGVGIHIILVFGTTIAKFAIQGSLEKVFHAASLISK